MNLPSTSTQRLLSWSWRGSTSLAAPASESWLAKPCTSLSSSFFLSNSEPISYWTKSTRRSLAMGRTQGGGLSTERRVDVLEYTFSHTHTHRDNLYIIKIIKHIHLPNRTRSNKDTTHCLSVSNIHKEFIVNWYKCLDPNDPYKIKNRCCKKAHTALRLYLHWGEVQSLAF